MTYAIAGVSGNTGTVAANTLLAQGEKIRVIVRDRAKGEPWAARGAEVAVADLGDAAALERALSGVDGAYVLVPPNMAATSFRRYQRETADAIVTAVDRARLPHLVLLSSVGAQHAAGTGPIAGIHYAEQQLRTLGHTRATFLRAGYFMENVGAALGMLDQGVVPSFLPADLPIPMIATVDIGKTAAALLVEGASATNVVELSIGTRTFDDVAAALSKLLGRTIAVAEAPLEALVPTYTGFGMPQELAEMYLEMHTGLLAGKVAFEGSGRTITATTDLDAVLGKLLGKA